ncbi:MAG: tetratricopeptide repeat protein [Proteobacteria bacterium]|nr:tetratricopeptide repeat protein [Pseudomonadota bacterium]
MSIDRSKVLAAAQKHLQRGNYDRALEEYQRLVRADPNDVRTLLKIGDLRARQGNGAQAIEAYDMVAKHYAEQGFFLKAVAVYKQILKLEPQRLEARTKLAEMYEMLSLVSDALNTYEQVANSYAERGDTASAITSLRRMVDLDPENVASQIKLAEALSKAKLNQEAVAAFRVAAGLLRQQDREDDYVKVAERLLFHRPDEAPLAQELARVYLNRGEAKHALAKLQPCFRADPRDCDTLELLAQAFRALGQVQKAVAVYREIAKLHHESGRLTERAAALERIVEIDPGDVEARTTLASMRPANALVTSGAHRVPSAGEGEEEIVEIDDDALELLESEAPPSGAPRPLSLPPTAAAPLAASLRPHAAALSGTNAPPVGPGEGQIERLLEECEVFTRYALHDKVISRLESILVLDPSHVTAHEKLKETFLSIGDTRRAAAQAARLADVVRGDDPEASDRYLAEARELAPDALQEPVEQAGPRTAAPEAPDSASDEDDSVIFIDEEQRLSRITKGVEAGTGSSQRSSTAGTGSGELRPTNPLPASDPMLQDQVAREAEALAEASPQELAASSPLRVVSGAAEEGDGGRIQASEPPASESASSARQASHASSDVSDAGAAELAQEIEETLEEADFYVAQGWLSEARSLLLDALGEHPGAHVIEDKLRELGGNAAAQPLDGAMDNDAPGSVVADDQRADERASSPEPGNDDSSGERATQLAVTTIPGPAIAGEDEQATTDTSASLPEVETTLTSDDLIEIDEDDSAVLEAVSLAPPASSGERSTSPAADERSPTESEAPTAAQTKEALDEPPASEPAMEEVLSQFKEGVRREVGQGDSQTHYDLGIAYMEMGLHDDAIQEFELCLDSDEHRCIAETMIGLSNVAKGDFANAVHHFTEGLRAPRRDHANELALYFELGNAHELLGNAALALDNYRHAHRLDPGFRDVKTRLERLTSRLEATAEEADEVDRLFDNILIKGD